jgi:hypothetical protein
MICKRREDRVACARKRSGNAVDHAKRNQMHGPAEQACRPHLIEQIGGHFGRPEEDARMQNLEVLAQRPGAGLVDLAEMKEFVPVERFEEYQVQLDRQTHGKQRYDCMKRTFGDVAGRRAGALQARGIAAGR